MEPLGETAVVGQQQQSLGVGVQAPDVEEPLLAVADEVSYARTTEIVTHRRDHTQGLVEGKVDARLVKLNPGPIDVDRLGVGIDPHTQLADDMPVDLDAACADEVLARSTTADTGRCQELLQAHAIGTVSY